MIKRLFQFILLLFIVACGSVKQTEKALSSGDYDSAIEIALKKLQTNKHKKGKQEYIVLLEDAFAKAVQRDSERIAFLRLEENAANKGEIYEIYLRLNERQEAIKPILPLKIIEQSRDAVFKFKNYNSQILTVKGEYSDHLYSKGKFLIDNASSKLDYRNAYQELVYLDQINPNYLNVRKLVDDAYYSGIEYVIVNVKNNTQMVIPERLETDLLNFGTYGLDDMWVVYHNNAMPNKRYDYQIDIDFRKINMSSEQIKEREVVKEIEVPDGTKYLEDKDGNLIKDENGKEIKVEKKKTVRFQYHEFTQFKSVSVVGNVQYRNLNSRQLLESFPLKSEFVFNHIYATGSGDKRALSSDLSNYLLAKSVKFPSNEQMVYDCGEDLKNQLKSIVKNYRF